MAYDYIRQFYGKEFWPGQRVRFAEYKGDRGHGVVLPEGPQGHYVRVRFKSGEEGSCHPNSVECDEARTDFENYVKNGSPF